MQVELLELNFDIYFIH